MGWEEDATHYYVEDNVPIGLCSQCTVHEVRSWVYAHSQAPLSGLDLFCGGGGLSAGLEQSGVVKMKWAIDSAKCASETYR